MNNITDFLNSIPFLTRTTEFERDCWCSFKVDEEEPTIRLTKSFFNQDSVHIKVCVLPSKEEVQIMIQLYFLPSQGWYVVFHGWVKEADDLKQIFSYLGINY